MIFLPAEMIRLLQVRNPLLACFKNYDDENLRRTHLEYLAWGGWGGGN